MFKQCRYIFGRNGDNISPPFLPRKEEIIINIEFGELVKTNRENKMIKKRELGRYVGISGQYVSMIENGYIPSDEIIVRLAMVLDINENEIFKAAKRLPPNIYEKVMEMYYSGKLKL